ncbi:hypothetical protein Forpe1208_v014535 [Fusarium oxysporum f. sp. rapae]|uniref:Uncharacterized protein n=1 Tax=Fusarium oxysporum f. sp. rapae TaxID=485398 RepID=A0A8J5NIK2_FUSOX|nr:hypothetical protein Forpe1208_v014535 [Fusarium oxysporum f. sp. rapae]
MSISGQHDDDDCCECRNQVVTDTKPSDPALCIVRVQNNRSADPLNDTGNHTVPDDGIVYWTFKDVRSFRASKGKRLNDCSISAAITKRQEQDVIKPVVDQYNREVLVKTVKRLMKEGVFSSPSKAKIRFPNLFPDSPDLPVCEDNQDPARQDNAVHDLHRDTLEKQAEEKINLDDWFSVPKTSQEEAGSEAMEQGMPAAKVRRGDDDAATEEKEAPEARTTDDREAIPSAVAL